MKHVPATFRKLLATLVSCSLVLPAIAPRVAFAQPGATPPSGAPGATPALPTDQPTGQPTGQPAGPVAPGEGAGPGATPPADPNAPSLGVPTPPVSMAPIKPLQLSAEDRKALLEIESEFTNFSTAADKHQGRMRDMMLREYASRTTKLEQRYAERIAKLESRKGQYNKDVIAKLERFIVEHPDHKKFTPDAMFRLADLYIDQADEEVDSRPASDAADPSAVIADYSKAIKLWETILAKFPDYRQLPPTLYLLAYYTKTDQPRRAMTLFLSLTCANRFKFTDAPLVELTKKQAMERIESKTLLDPYGDCKAMDNAEAELVRHAWVRGLADYHFTVPGEIDEAISAYNKVANGGTDSSLYAESLYKLAWSYYRRDFLFESIKRFDESVKLYDKVVADGGTPSLELREESIQYISVAFTDPWAGETDSNPDKAFERAKDFYKGRENESHVRDVWVGLGKAFADLQAYDRAVDAYRIALGPPWELKSDAPVVHQEIVNVLELKGDKFAADNEAAALATRYQVGSAWYQANEKDREAMDNQRRLAERALYAAALNTHRTATQGRGDWEAGGKKDAELRKTYIEDYNRAVNLYRTFIQQYPESDYVYEFTYLQGEALYFSERYLEAVEQYRWVRDHRDMSEKYFLQSAQSILQAYEAEAGRLVAEGKISPLKVPSADELKAMPQPLTPQPIPEIYQLLQNEWDNYQNIVNDPKTAPQQGINAALVSLAYLRIDDSIARFQKVMDKFCGNNEAVRAKDALLSVYEATNQLDQFEATNKKFIATKCGDTKSIELAQSQNRSIEFKRANLLFAEKQYLQAAESFYKYYKTAPATDADLPIALYNSAVGYRLANRPLTAISLFKEFTANKDKRFRESPFYLDAVRYTASSYQASFEYDKAITTYLELNATAKKAKALGIKPPQPLPGEEPRTLDRIAADALFNAAFAAEVSRDFKRAIDLYGRYEREETDRKRKDEASWSVANIYRSSGDANSTADAFEKWRRTYGKDEGNANRFVQSHYDTAALWKRKNQLTKAEAAGQATIDAWKAVGSARGSDGAKMAGEWQLYFADKFYFAKFEPFAITKAAKTLDEVKKQQADIKAVTTATQDKYLALDAYGVAEYSMAAKVRFGETTQKYAQKLSEAPIPVPISKSPDAVATFEEQRDKNLVKYLNEARAQWSEVVSAARQGGISNKWSQLAQENLAREFPGEFTVLRQEVIEGTEAP